MGNATSGIYPEHLKIISILNARKHFDTNDRFKMFSTREHILKLALWKSPLNQNTFRFRKKILKSVPALVFGGVERAENELGQFLFYITKSTSIR